jgi:hypothetical protein
MMSVPSSSAIAHDYVGSEEPVLPPTTIALVDDISATDNLALPAEGETEPQDLTAHQFQSIVNSANALSQLFGQVRYVDSVE